MRCLLALLAGQAASVAAAEQAARCLSDLLALDPRNAAAFERLTEETPSSKKLLEELSTDGGKMESSPPTRDLGDGKGGGGGGLVEHSAHALQAGL